VDYFYSAAKHRSRGVLWPIFTPALIAGNSEWVFPSEVSASHYISNNTILKALERIGFKGEMFRSPVI
jgi:hypothetical protein